MNNEYILYRLVFFYTNKVFLLSLDVVIKLHLQRYSGIKGDILVDMKVLYHYYIYN